MKYLVKFFVVTVFIIFSTQVFAEQKIVVLDMKYVLNNSKSGKNAQEFLKKQFNDNAKKLSELEKSLKKEEADLLDSKASLSKEEYKAKSDSLRKKVVRLNGYISMIKFSDYLPLVEEVFTTNKDRFFISQSIKKSFDPKRILNPGKMYTGI